MSIRRQIFLGIFAIVSGGLFFFLHWIIDDLEPQYRTSAEEPLVDAANVLAAIAGQLMQENKATGTLTAGGGDFDAALFRRAFKEVYQRRLSAQIYNFSKTQVDFRVYLTDSKGIVIFDSALGQGAGLDLRGRDEGKDYSAWRDVRLALAGEYGARTSRDIPGNNQDSVMYVAAPIFGAGGVIGVLSIGKPTRTANQLVQRAKTKLLYGGLIAGLLLLLSVLLFSAVITRPISRLTRYAHEVRQGRRVSFPPLYGREIVELGAAFEQMRDSLEGKQYVERYVQTLTHEMKSPLAAIQGAVELLQESPPADKQRQFLHNLSTESERIRQLVDKLLLLSAVESRKVPPDKVAVDVVELLSDVISSMSPSIESKGLKVRCAGESAAICAGEKFLLRQALANVLQNAIEFSPQDQEIVCQVERSPREVRVIVEDQGAGIPEYARDRIYDRFYSLERPATGKKSSGLGLSLVKEVVELHGGVVSIGNKSPRGVRAEVRLPV